MDNYKGGQSIITMECLNKNLKKKQLVLLFENKKMLANLI